MLLLPSLVRFAAYLVLSGLGLVFSIAATTIYILTCGLCCRGRRPSKAGRRAAKNAKKKKKAMAEKELRRSKRTEKRVNNVENPTVHKT